MQLKPGNRPSALRQIYEKWKRAARKVGDVQARFMLSVFYFIVVGPVALMMRLRSDPSSPKAGSPRGWHPRRDRPGTLDLARKQF